MTPFSAIDVKVKERVRSAGNLFTEALYILDFERMKKERLHVFLIVFQIIRFCVAGKATQMFERHGELV